MDYKNILKFLKKNKYLVLLLILLSAFIIRIYYFGLTYNQPLWWDEADYMSYAKLIGKNLNINNIWYYRRTFFLPLLWGSLFKIGLEESAIRFTEVLLSLGVVLFAYLVAKEMFNKTIGLIAATGMAFSRLVLFAGTRFLTALPATFFFLVGLFFFWKGYVKKQNNKFIYLAGLFIGLAMFSRFGLLLCLVPLALYIFINEKARFWKNKHIWIGILVLLLVLTPYFIMYKQRYPGGIYDFIQHYTDFGVEETQKTVYMGIPGIWGYIKSISFNIGLVFSIFAIIGCSLFLNLLGIDKIFNNKKVKKALFILVWILTPVVYHGMFSEYVQERYVLWAYPAVLMLAGLGITKTYNYFKKYNKAVLNLSIIILITFLICFNSYTQIRLGDELIKNKLTSYAPVKYAGLWMKENSKSEDIIISNSVPQTQYYSERSTYMVGNASHLEKLKPKFIVLSIFENSKGKEWFFKYPEEKNLNVVQAYFLDKEQTNPSLVIYLFS